MISEDEVIDYGVSGPLCLLIQRWIFSMGGCSLRGLLRIPLESQLSTFNDSNRFFP